MTKHSHYRRQIMKDAWKAARAGASQFGGTVRSYLAAALKDAWSKAKACPYAKETAAILANLSPLPKHRDRLIYRSASFFNPW